MVLPSRVEFDSSALKCWLMSFCSLDPYHVVVFHLTNISCVVAWLVETKHSPMLHSLCALGNWWVYFLNPKNKKILCCFTPCLVRLYWVFGSGRKCMTVGWTCLCWSGWSLHTLQDWVCMPHFGQSHCWVSDLWCLQKAGIQASLCRTFQTLKIHKPESKKTGTHIRTVESTGHGNWSWTWSFPVLVSWCQQIK